jgi:general secretion pathway protein K
MIAFKKRPGDEGIVLIVVLWVMTGLAALTLSFSRESRIEVMATRNARSMERAYYIARAGMENTIYRIIQRRMTPVSQTAIGGGEPGPIDIGKVTGSFDGGFWRVNIQDESGKININTVSEQQLDALIRAAGIENPDALILVESILDWRDTDSISRANGAEDEYYQSLDPPYMAKNSRFDAVEELLLVRGMTRDYFYGKPERMQDGTVEYKYGLSRFVTVYSTRDQINVNHAALPVLLSIPGMTYEAARMIYERRLIQPFQATAEIAREIPFPLGAAVMSRLTTAQTGVLTLTAEAQEEGSRVRRVIRAVISLDSIGTQNPYQILYWNENISDYEGGTS